jgi:hypothetical protein
VAIVLEAELLEQDDLPEPCMFVNRDELAAPEFEQLPELVKLADPEPPLFEVEILQLLAFAICVGDMPGTKRIVKRAITAHIESTNFFIFFDYNAAIYAYSKIIVKNHVVGNDNQTIPYIARRDSFRLTLTD